MNKKPILKLAASAALGTFLLSGCATPNHDTGMAGTATESAPSTLSFSPVTDPRELTKWSMSPYFQRNLRSIDTYVLATPAPGAIATAETTTLPEGTPVPEFTANLEPGQVFVESAGGEVRTYRVITHRPNQR